MKHSHDSHNYGGKAFWKLTKEGIRVRPSFVIGARVRPATAPHWRAALEYAQRKACSARLEHALGEARCEVDRAIVAGSNGG